MAFANLDVEKQDDFEPKKPPRKVAQLHLKIRFNRLEYVGAHNFCTIFF